MSWGYKIIIVYCLFVLGIAYLVLRSTREKVDLVTPDYYAEELKFQNRIDESNRVTKLSAPVNVTCRKDSLSLLLPQEFSGQPVSGEIVFYYPADKNRDAHMSFETTNAAFKTMLPKGISGQHDLQIKWSAGGADYFFEQKIFF